MASLSLRDVALRHGAIVVVAARSYPIPWHDREDLIAETVLELLERHRRQPGKRVRWPWQAIGLAMSEASRRLTQRRAFPVSPGRLQRLAVPPDIWVRERLEERLADETTEDQIAEWARLAAAERDRRMREADRALGTMG